MYQEILLTSTFTIIGGIIVFAGTQILNEILIKPVTLLKEEIGKIFFVLTYYSNLYTNPNLRGMMIDVDKNNASDELRKRASHLKASMNAVPTIALKLFRLPLKKELSEVSDNLIFLSNSIFSGDALHNQRVREKTQKLLKMKKY